MFQNTSKYTKGIVGFNVLSLLSLSLYFWNGWNFQLFPFVELFFFFDFLVIALATIFYALWIHALRKSINKKHIPKTAWIMLIIFFSVCLYGLGMHNGANQIGKFIDEPVVVFYDEILSHYISSIALLGVGITFALLQSNLPYTQKLHYFEKVIIVISGIFQGIIGGVAYLEARGSIIALILCIIFCIILAQKIIFKPIARFPLSWYYLLYFFTMVVFILCYYILFKGFSEPSVLGFGRF